MESYISKLFNRLMFIKGWNHAVDMCKNRNGHWALYAKSVLDRTRLSLSHKAEWYQRVLQPSAEYLGALLGVDQWAVRTKCVTINEQ